MNDFDALVEEFLADQYATTPTLASRLGVEGYDDRLPDLSADAIRAQERRDDEWAARFAGLDDGELGPDERIDRDLVLMTLRRRSILREFAGWRRYPESYLDPVLDGVFSLFLHRLRPEPELVRAAAARLRGLPELLAAARANLDPRLAPPMLVERAVQHARGAVDYLRTWVPREVSEGSGRATIVDAAEGACSAVGEHVDFLTDLAECAHGDWAIGEDRYSALLREAEGLPYGARELRERGRAAYDELAADLSGRARELGGDDWRALLHELARDHPATPEEMRAAYAGWTGRARAFCVERDLVTLPDGESCVVAPSPPFTRPVTAVAFYVSPPAFSDRRAGHFFVPFPPEGAAAEQVAQRLASNSHTTIPTTSVHEAYPGHHWHLAWIAASCARPLRKVLGSAYFIEGWALYTEQLLQEHGFFADPRHALGQVEARMFRAARILVDTSLHMGEMTVEQAETFMVDNAALSAETARAEVRRYCSWPTQASSYLTGATEIARMRDEYVGGGHGTLRNFHDRLAGSGMLPLGLAERALYRA